MKLTTQIYLLLFMFICSCTKPEPNKETNAFVKEENTLTTTSGGFDYPVEKETYVPIYSDIYNDTRDTRILLTATLSIRNTSSNDTLFINYVDYYNSDGDKVRSYIKNPIFLKPLQTIDYVIDKEDESGGSGANFLIGWGAKKSVTPLFQGVMIGIYGQQGFSFATEGIEVKSN